MEEILNDIISWLKFKISKIDLSKCRPYKDFGKGFYCTTIKKQAEFMAERVVKRQGRSKNSKYI